MYPGNQKLQADESRGKRIGAITNEILDETIHTDEDDDNDGTVGKIAGPHKFIPSSSICLSFSKECVKFPRKLAFAKEVSS